MQQKRRDNTPIRGTLPHIRVCCPRNCGFDNPSNGWTPAQPFFGFLIQFIYFGTDGITQAAFDALVLIPVPGFSFFIQFQGTIVDGRTKRHAPPASMAKPRFLHILYQIIKGSHHYFALR
jgi:hypothetical protein